MGMRAAPASATILGAVARERWMAGAFALGSACFMIGPLRGYASLVGAGADGVTFLVGSILFTIGGALQTWLALPDRHASHRARAAWWAAVLQSVGTLAFNVTTYRAMSTAVSNAHYNRLVWRPDAVGSNCFLVSGGIAYRARRPGAAGGRCARARAGGCRR